MITRRLVLGGLASLSLEGPALAACGCGRAIVAPYGGILLPPNHPDWVDARRILDAAPTGPEGHAVAVYLSSIDPKYNHQWTGKLANPLIVDLFADLGLKSEGDTTSWCAAFVNWCLKRADIEGTDCAWAQSFVDWGDPVWSRGDAGLRQKAQVGDVAVFQLKSDPCQGHVAFVAGFNADTTIDVLGGNQYILIGHKKIYSIDTKPLGIDDKFRLLAIRRTP